MFSTTWRIFRTASCPITLTDHKLLITIILLTASITINVYVIIAVSRKAPLPVCYPKMQDNAFTSTRTVWLEELPVGDRVGEQMFYVPKGYKYDEAPVKRILVYNGRGFVWEIIQPHQAQFVGCPVSRCWITFDQDDGPEVDAVLFRHSFSRPHFQKPPNQVWIMYNTEAPYSTKTVKHEDRDAFNWTANYRWDSDIPIPYGYYSKYSESPAGLKNVHVNHAEGKTKKVAMFVSNCHAHSGRLQYARELSEHIAVDIYGRCGTMTCSITDESACFDMLARDYKFYLSFENSLCHYYITEKLFRNALQNNVLPIVMGPGRADYEMVAPKNSFLHVDDFGSPKELAEYLHVLDQSPSMYNEFFQWKNNGSITTDTRFYCRLCAMLHDEQRPRKHYENFPEWWDGLGVCQKKY